MNYGTVGTSPITNNFIESAKLVDGLTLAAVYSRSLEKGRAFSEKYGVKTVFTDLTQMAESELIDAVYVASPNSLHYEQCKVFLEHGKHVLCEKPITAAAAQVKELVALAKEKHLIYMEAIKMLHRPERPLLLDALKRIGKITTARIDYCQLSSKYPSYLAGNLPNIFNPKLATGCLMDIGVYCVYPAIDLFGVPEKIITTAGFLSTGADGFGNSIFLYKDKQVNLSYSKTGQSRLGSEILGDKGTIVVNSISRFTDMKIVWNDKSEESLAGDASTQVVMSGEARSFYNYVTNPEKYRKEYEYASDLAIKVSETMELMREQAGIKFE
jgi:predicted dehydrogenase